jgi:hypothetical protein
MLQIVAAHRKIGSRLSLRHNQNEARTPRSGTGHIEQRGAERPSLCAPFPSQGVPARGRVIIRNADNAITAALGRARHKTEPTRNLVGIAALPCLMMVCLPAPNPSYFPKSRGFPFVSNYYAYWPPTDRLLLGLRLLAPGAVEHEDFRQPAEMRDRLDEFHRLSAVRAQGQSGCIGQHKQRLRCLRRDNFDRNQSGTLSDGHAPYLRRCSEHVTSSSYGLPCHRYRKTRLNPMLLNPLTASRNRRALGDGWQLPKKRASAAATLR